MLGSGVTFLGYGFRSEGAEFSNATALEVKILGLGLGLGFRVYGTRFKVDA